MDKMRQEFERWFADKYAPLGAGWAKKDCDGVYLFDDANISWAAWKASRSVADIELTAGCCGHAITVDELRSMLSKAGVTLKDGNK